LIAVDWGTSNFRAFRLQPGGGILERRSSPRGVLHVKKEEFESVLCQEIGDWLDDGETEVLLSGMVGSRQGWVEAPYLPCPVGIADLAAAAARVPFSRAHVRLVPGVSGSDEDGVPEVMRGEETETMGILDMGQGDGLVCFPGSHSKWVQLQDSKISAFRTYLTGELFAALRNCTILGRTMAGSEAAVGEAFARGVARSAQSGGLLHHLFGVRTLALMRQMEEDVSASYLSGLLVGHEVRCAMPAGAEVRLVGLTSLSSLYARAIEMCGGLARVQGGYAAARGLAAIGAKLTWN
jgi:2-dehydro-3-deoxygalactonokinase